MSAAPAFQAALGLAVKARRVELRLTQEQLDLRTDLHQRWTSNFETGKRNPSYGAPDAKPQDSISRLLAVSPSGADRGQRCRGPERGRPVAR